MASLLVANSIRNANAERHTYTTHPHKDARLAEQKISTNYRTGVLIATGGSQDAKLPSGISIMERSSLLMALTAASTSGRTFLMKYFALATFPV